MLQSLERQKQIVEIFTDFFINKVYLTFGAESKMAKYKLRKSILFMTVLVLCISGALCQKDCTGVDCPLLEHCIEEVLERGACCASCLQKGCTCEGYQYYDCINAGFRNGKVPEGESYFVDFGSTECSCPKGGGKISCHFIPCPEVPPHCIEFSEPSDGCLQCERFGCVHDGHKYDAGHTFQMDPCKVCHCPHAGGELMCYPVPDCDLGTFQTPPLFPTAHEENTSEKNNDELSNYERAGSEDRLSQISHLPQSEKLPLFKTDIKDEDEDYDYTPTDSAKSSLFDLAVPTKSAVTLVSYSDKPTAHEMFNEDLKQELRQKIRTQEEETKNEEITEDPLVGPTSQVFQDVRKSMEGISGKGAEDYVTPHMAEEEHEEDEQVVTLKDVTEGGTDRKEVTYVIDHELQTTETVPAVESNSHSSTTEENFLVQEDPLGKHGQAVLPTIKFSPTTQPPQIMKAVEALISKKQSQTLYNYQPERERRNNSVDSHPASQGVSGHLLVASCCEAGQKWASDNGHCTGMPQREVNTCRIAEQQCCLGHLRDSKCLAGMTAAKEGKMCELGERDICGADSYMECCSCCSLGLQFRSEGHNCDSHQHLVYPCSHMFLTCCEGEDGLSQPTLRERQKPEPTSLPKRDGTYDKEAFSITDEEGNENTVEKGEDIDECLEYEGQLCHQRCINTRTSYECACFPGYILLSDGYSCEPENPEEEDNRLREEDRPATPVPTVAASTTVIPVDLCAGNGPCMHVCSQAAGEVLCSCFPGYALMADGHSCEDVNECHSGTHSCSRGVLCVNSKGSFQCVRVNEPCEEGFIYNVNRECVDINECLTNTHSCQAMERCINTIGSFTCEKQITCSPGYQLKEDTCEDIDECLQQTHNCGTGFECQNTAGSFYCNPKHRCFTGFSQDQHGNCIDIDECSSPNVPCSPGFNCINTVGSYTCQRKIIVCSRGYHASPDGARCIDVDECQTGVHRCGEGQICHNLPGTYRCDCKTGYQYDMFRKVCVDVNECWRYPGRLCAQTCENTPGSYQCSCTTGFTLSSDGKNCEDVNECEKNPCSQECANIYGSYQCYCRQGFYLKEDGHSCEDIDECSQSVGNLCAFQCVNVPGSYQCACPAHGYTMSPNGRTCRDIDECAVGTHNCSTAETCYNIQGGFRCLSFSCPPNYRRVSDTRCERLSCPNYVECQSSPLRITYYHLSFQTNIVIPAQIFRIGPSPAYSGDNIIISITRGNEENYFSARKLNSYTGAVYLQRQVREPKDFLIDVEMKLWRQGNFTTFLARIYVFITAPSL
nr:PREDICTED: fibulin-2 isoform X2 [Lepisosteus oculatus]